MRHYFYSSIKFSIIGLLGFYYDINVTVAGDAVATMVENGGASVTPDGVDDYASHVRHVVEVTMEAGDDLGFMVNANLFPYTNKGLS